MTQHRRAACTIGVFAIAAFTWRPAEGQTIRGRVLLPDDNTPAAGVVITALTIDDATAGQVLSTDSGEYVLHLQAPGQYRLRVLRIGFRPALIDSVIVEPSEVRTLEIVLHSLPIALNQVVVRTRRTCDLAGSSAQMFLQVWEQARAALTATHLSQARGGLDLQIIRVDGHVDAVKYNQARHRDWLALPYPETDTVHARERIADRLFATPAETLALAGYVRRASDGGGFTFDVPSASALVSDAFVAQHCFSIETAPRDHPDWIGIGFTPQQKRDSIVDIRGVFWLDAASAELRRLDFEYANLPSATLRLCDPEPDRQFISAPGPVCDQGFNTDDNQLGLGGYADYLHLTSGNWVISRWLIRMPPDGMKIRWTGARSHQIGHGRTETCYTGDDCYKFSAEWPRLVTTAGMLARVLRDGQELFRDDSALALIAGASAKQAGQHPSRVGGIVNDRDGHLLAGAIVQIEDPGRVATTDSTGAFSIQMLPPVTVTLDVRCRGYRSFRTSLPLARDSTLRVSLTLGADGTNAVLRDTKMFSGVTGAFPQSAPRSEGRVRCRGRSDLN